MKKILTGIVCLLMVGIFLRVPIAAAGEISSVAQAWMWVSEEKQENLFMHLQKYATVNSLRFGMRVIPALDWKMTEVALETPEGNSIRIINATASDKFSVALMPYNTKEDWKVYWVKFRSEFSQEYEWKDIIY